MSRKAVHRITEPSDSGALGWTTAARDVSTAATHGLERLTAVAYGLTYDAVVRGFRPFDALLDEIAALIGRSAPGPGRRAAVTVLDVACGIGTVANRLAREGYTVVGLDAVEHLVDVARARSAGENPRFEHLDLAQAPLPDTGTFDVLVSMHTLYWHPQPRALLDACRRALRPDGRAVFLTYSRRAEVARTFREIRAREGLGAAVRALRWLVPTAVFEQFRDCELRYLSRDEFHRELEQSGFQVLESRDTFLAGISLLVWAKPRDSRFGVSQGTDPGHGEETRA